MKTARIAHAPDKRDADSFHSSRREKLIEHMFVGDVLRHLWCSGYHEVDVLRAETDAGGYDIVIEANSDIRHIQLKSSALGATTRVQKVNVALWEKPSGCVVWVRFSPETLSLGPFLWFGAEPGKSLHARSDPNELPTAKHSKGNAQGEKAERKNIRQLNIGKFDRIETVSGLVEKLFGLRTGNA